MWLFKDANKTSVTVRPGTIIQKIATVRSIQEEEEMVNIKGESKNPANWSCDRSFPLLFENHNQRLPPLATCVFLHTIEDPKEFLRSEL